jgi:hypothetical protein
MLFWGTDVFSSLRKWHGVPNANLRSIGIERYAPKVFQKSLGICNVLSEPRVPCWKLLKISAFSPPPNWLHVHNHNFAMWASVLAAFSALNADLQVWLRPDSEVLRIAIMIANLLQLGDTIWFLSMHNVRPRPQGQGCAAKGDGRRKRQHLL